MNVVLLNYGLFSVWISTTHASMSGGNKNDYDTAIIFFLYDLPAICLQPLHYYFQQWWVIQAEDAFEYF